MGLNTHIFLAMMIMINMVSQFAIDMHNELSAEESERLNQMITESETHAQEFEQEEAVPQVNSQQETSTGNIITMGGRLFTLFVKGLSPWFIGVDQLRSAAEKVVFNALLIFKLLLYYAIILEGYLIYKNRKT